MRSSIRVQPKRALSFSFACTLQAKRARENSLIGQINV